MTDLKNPQVTEDTLFDRRLLCRQYLDGYRFSIDPVLVAHFSRPKKQSKILDLGAGCGVISLILAYRYSSTVKTITALEIQNSLFELLCENVSLNELESIIFPVSGDLKNVLSHLEPESIDHIYCNPPYFRCGSGRTSNNQEAYGARHQIHADLNDIAVAAKRVLVNKGAMTLCYPAKRITELFENLTAQRLEVKKIQLVYSYPEASRASLVLVDAVKNGGRECEVLPPFYVYGYRNGGYSEEMQKLYQ